MTPYSTLKEEAWKANLQIPERKLALYTWGNVSAFDKDKGVFAIKPSGIPYDELTIDDMVVLDLEGRVVEGKRNPSSDTPTHLELYKKFEGIGGITHTHSTYATSWAQAARSAPDHLAEVAPTWSAHNRASHSVAAQIQRPRPDAEMPAWPRRPDPVSQNHAGKGSCLAPQMISRRGQYRDPHDAPNRRLMAAYTYIAR